MQVCPIVIWLVVSCFLGAKWCCILVVDVLDMWLASGNGDTAAWCAAIYYW